MDIDEVYRLGMLAGIWYDNHGTRVLQDMRPPALLRFVELILAADRSLVINGKEWRRGNDDPSSEDHLAVAGIHVGKHGNAIECYATDLPTAQARRDFILAAIDHPPVAPPGLIELLREIRPKHGAVGTRDIDVTEQQRKIDAAIALLSSDRPPNQENSNG